MNIFQIRIESPDDETECYTLLDQKGNEWTLAYVTHDEHGWSGMNVARDVITTFAEVLGIRMFIQENGEE